MRKEESSNCLFQMPWWLDAVAPGGWDEVTVEKGGEIVARLPYTHRKRFGMTVIGSPPLTQTLGPWIKHTPAKYAKSLGRQIKLYKELIDKLPAFDLFVQAFHHSVTNWLPFYWEGFKQTTQYSYVLDDLSDLDKVWDGFVGKTRSSINKACKQVKVFDNISAKDFLKVVEMTYERQGLCIPWSGSLFERIDDACKERRCRDMLAAIDKIGRIHAVVYIVRDHRTSYYLIGGGDPSLRSSGASSLLMWEAIQRSSRFSMSFDFEGSMIPSVEPFFRAFGARQVPYSRLTKASRKMRLLQNGRSFLQTFVGR